ncbi:SpoIIE family protein phosphatase [Streptomyces acidicola]|uniref:SpoIIE family protein phosphatase n=1 Tax=Streptomyces acidicola TaxID=2596892 RepID=UPI0034385C81
MHGSSERDAPAPGRPQAVLIAAVVEAMRALSGCAGGVYLRSGAPGLLRLAVLAGVPGRLFRPWWQLHVDRQFPAADAYRRGTHVVLPDATETMRRYPQFAAGLPFRFGSVYVPVVAGSMTYGVLTVLRPAAPDTAAVLSDDDVVTGIADRLGAGLRALEVEGAEIVWDGDPLCVRPPATGSPVGRVGHFTWDPAAGTVTMDDALRVLAGCVPEDLPGTPEAFAEAVASDDAPLVLDALHAVAAGHPAGRPLRVRSADGALRLLECWMPQAPPVVRGLVVDPGPGPAADGAADLLPDGVFAFDRLGLITYVNPRGAELLGRPRTELVGRPLSQAVPWLRQPSYEDHLRGALLSPDPVNFHVRRPHPDGPGPGRHGHDGDWLTLSVHPGPDVMTCRLVPLGQIADAAEAAPVDEAPPTTAGVASIAPVYRPIFLAIALTEAVTAQQVSEVVMRELLPAFGGRRLAIYLLYERHLYLAWETGYAQGFLSEFEGMGLDARLPAVDALTTGKPLFFESLGQLEALYPGVRLDGTEGARAFLPLIASGRPVGSCILGFDGPRGFSGQERTVLTALAGLIAQALERARRYDTEATIARALQEALLPRRLSAHPRVETAGCYLPGTQGIDVGGDWYDVVETGDGLALVIGDVQGRGVQAAATMGQLRSAVRAFAVGDHPPDEVMSGTNRLLIDLDPGQFASCCYIRLDPVTGVARAARAGHPQPLLRHPGGRTDVLDLPGGVVLGVDPEARYPVTELCLESGAVLALYTDGLVERPGRDIDEGIEALRTALSLAAVPAEKPDGASLGGVADELTDEARHTTDRPDDIALLLATLHRDDERHP